MKLIAQVKLLPSPEQADLLKKTVETSNAAANFLSDLAWDGQTFGQYNLHHIGYHLIRERFGLSAQMTVRLIAKVANAYKLDCKSKRTFRPLGSIAYDSRILTWKLSKLQVSIWTMDGRERMPFVCGEKQKAMLETYQGEADLVFRNGAWYLHQPCEIEEPDVIGVEDFLGVDIGIVNIAVDSDGTTHQGKTVSNVRYRHRKLRAKLQRKGTKSSRRRLKKLAGKEHRFATWVNHNVSKSIVAKAKDTGRGIAVEELGGIRDRVTVRRSQRATLHSWSFFQLRAFLEYKAKLTGVNMVAVDRTNTSITCPCCGCTEKTNRKGQAKFLCVSCGFSGLADHIAAMNISRRAVVNRPYVSDAGGDCHLQRQGQSPRL